ncbi:MAG: hypothetical protein JNK05_41340 [Myxococcales bacterium]|nr:hypothetical protein [Myxococcales bacterium]
MISRSLVAGALVLASVRGAHAQQAPGAQPSVRTLWIRPTDVSDPVAIGGVAEGTVAGERLGAGCRGAYPAFPQQQVWVAAPTAILDVLVRAAGPTSLALRTPQGAVFCTQGAPGSESRFTLRNVQPGTYVFAVGTVEGNALPYNLAVSQRAVIAAASIALPTTPAAVGTPVANSGTAATTTPTTLANAQPAGAANATQGATTSVPTGWVSVSATGANNAASATNTANGVSASGATNTTSVAQPATSGPSGAIDVSPSGAPTQRASATVVGRASLRFVGRTCLGFGERTPSARFTVRAGVSFVRVFARANADSTIAVRAPNGTVYCADDTFGAHPGVDVTDPPAGEWRVFVGTYAPRIRMPFELTVTTQRDARPE